MRGLETRKHFVSVLRCPITCHLSAQGELTVPAAGRAAKNGMMQAALLTRERETSTAVITGSLEEANHSNRKICSWSVV